jgi:hypothetical protein
MTTGPHSEGSGPLDALDRRLDQPKRISIRLMEMRPRDDRTVPCRAVIGARSPSPAVDGNLCLVRTCSSVEAEYGRWPAEVSRKAGGLLREQ